VENGLKDDVHSVLRISSAHNKGGPTDINIAQILHLSNFFELKRRVCIHLQAWQTKKVLDIRLVYHRVRSLQDQKNSKTFKFQRFFLPIFKDFSKTFESNRLSKNCECKHHFYPVISPVKSHPKMHLFVDIFEKLVLQSTYFIS
jgi:hypothetical protein